MSRGGHRSELWTVCGAWTEPGPTKVPTSVRLVRISVFWIMKRRRRLFLIMPSPWQPFPLSQWACLRLYCSCSVTQMRSSTVTHNQQEETSYCRITGERNTLRKVKSWFLERITRKVLNRFYRNCLETIMGWKNRWLHFSEASEILLLLPISILYNRSNELLG